MWMDCRNNENWKAVVGYEGFYEVSSLGKIRSVERMVDGRNAHGPHKRRQRSVLLKQTPAKRTGYLYACLCKDGEVSVRTVHSIVCQAFHGPRGDGQECSHRNGVRTDNRAENLAWLSHLENMRHRDAHGTANKGEKAHQAKLTANDVHEIRRLRASGVSGTSLAKKYGVHYSTIYYAASGKNWSDPNYGLPGAVADIPHEGPIS